MTEQDLGRWASMGVGGRKLGGGGRTFLAFLGGGSAVAGAGKVCKVSAPA